MGLWFLKSLGMRSCGEVGDIIKRGENAAHLQSCGNSLVSKMLLVFSVIAVK